MVVKVGNVISRMFLIGLASSVFAASATTFLPRVTREALVNPGMGWVYYHFDDGNFYYGAETKPGDVLDSFPGMSTVYFRIPWSDIEPEEGKFRWDVIDSVAQPWIAAGKQICFRFTCQEGSHTYSVPKWVVDAGAKGEVIVSKRFGNRSMWDPDWLDPIFLEKYGNFLAAAARKWDGHPALAFIDVGSFGLWGEGHTGNTRKIDGVKTRQIAIVHSKLLRKHFKRSQIVISDDVCGSWNKAQDDPCLVELRKLGVGLRDDSIMVSHKPNQWFHGGWARKAVAEGLLSVVETRHFWPETELPPEKRCWFKGGLLESTVDYQAHFQGVHWWPEEFLKMNREEIDRVNLRLGYRFELREVTLPDDLQIGKRVKIVAKWANVAVAPPTGECVAAWSLVDEKGALCWTAIDDDFDFRKLKPTVEGEVEVMTVESQIAFGWDFPSYQKPNSKPKPLIRHDGTMRSQFDSEKVPTIAPGEYTLAVSVGDRAGTPKIALAIEGQLGKTRRYALGKVRLGCRE